MREREAAWFRMKAATVVFAIVMFQGASRAYALPFGDSYGHQVQIELSGSDGSVRVWNDDPLNWYVNAQGFVQHLGSDFLHHVRSDSQ